MHHLVLHAVRITARCCSFCFSFPAALRGLSGAGYSGQTGRQTGPGPPEIDVQQLFTKLSDGAAV